MKLATFDYKNDKTNRSEFGLARCLTTARRIVVKVPRFIVLGL